MKIVETNLIEKDDVYTIDFEDFEAKASDPECKALILCSPHNPIGRVWTKEELARIIDICLKHDVFIIDDEIHHDLVLEGYHHYALPTVDERVLDHCIVCTATSKTFNLAGMQISNIIIPNETVREAFGKSAGMNVLSYQSVILAYNEAEDWLDALLEHLKANEQLVKDFLAKELPMVKASPLEGTYLMWLDLRSLGLTDDELEALLVKHDFFINMGVSFGSNAQGFVRVNIACPSSILQKS